MSKDGVCTSFERQAVLRADTAGSARHGQAGVLGQQRQEPDQNTSTHLFSLASQRWISKFRKQANGEGAKTRGVGLALVLPAPGPSSQRDAGQRGVALGVPTPGLGSERSSRRAEGRPAGWGCEPGRGSPRWRVRGAGARLRLLQSIPASRRKGSRPASGILSGAQLAKTRPPFQAPSSLPEEAVGRYFPLDQAGRRLERLSASEPTAGNACQGRGSGRARCQPGQGVLQEDFRPGKKLRASSPDARTARVSAGHGALPHHGITHPRQRPASRGAASSRRRRRRTLNAFTKTQQNHILTHEREKNLGSP